MNEQAKRDIFAIIGLPPEVLAVAMAKYSRSKQPIRETINELTEEKSAAFHEKWVLGYGDASVADMAVISIALENVSILASKAIQDNRLASYQEKSTRYVDFDPTRFYRPRAVMTKHGELYEKTVNNLFAAYQKITDMTIEHFRQRFLQPDAQKDKMYEKKLKARSLDTARYLLPVATLTNFGLIMNARGLRHAIAKLLGNSYQEIREIGKEIKQAALNPAYNPQSKKLKETLAKIKKLDHKKNGELAVGISKLASLQVKGAPTLIKYTDPPQYYAESQTKLEAYAKELLPDNPIDVPRVDYIPHHESENELVATLLYSACHLPYRQILDVVRGLPVNKKSQIIDTVSATRGQHDQPRREYEIGQFTFDVFMDYGAFRDLQRHRMCTQINQPLTTMHGYENPFELFGINDARIIKEFKSAIAQTMTTYKTIRHDVGIEADYLIPMAFKKRTLFRMNLRELYHMVELRSKSGGHMSYRKIVLDMYETIKKAHPLLVKDLRAITPNFNEDFFNR